MQVCHAVLGPALQTVMVNTSAEAGVQWLRVTAYLLSLLLLVVIPADFCLIPIPDHKLVTTTPVHEPFLHKQTRSLQASIANVHG